MPERHTAAPATDQTIQPALDPERETAPEKKKAGLDLSPFQVLGGALAAMTAAALGSRFGIEGTITGTALASVIAAIATAVYTASLRRTSDTVRTVLVKRLTHATGPAGRATAAQPVSRGSTSIAVVPDPPAGSGSPADASSRTDRRRALLIKSLVGAVATFALAAGGLTLYEAIAGQALSGGSGTTFSQVQQGQREDRPTDEQAPAPNESAEPSSTAESSTEPSVTPQAESSSTTSEPSAEPTEEPSAASSATSEPEPSATTAPSGAAAPSQPAPTPR